jgi:hypothetical protein
MLAVGHAELRRCAPDAEWDRAISLHRDASIFHTSAWARVIQETYRFEPFYFRTENSAPVAALALFEVTSWLTGRRGVALPFTDECAPLCSDEHSFGKLFEFARQIGERRNWKSIEMRDCSEWEGSRRSSLSFYGHALEMNVDAPTLFKGFHESVRRAIRKAEKSGVDITFENSESGMREYYKLHCITRGKHGLPPQPFDFFRSIGRNLISPGLGFITLARFKGRPIGGAVFFTHESKALYKFGASDPRYDRLRPNNLVMWRAIQRLCASGVKQLDFGRTSFHNEGLRRYKLNWGVRERTINYLKWDYRRSAVAHERDASAGWQNYFFHLCPAALARALGRILYPHIA